MSQTPKVPVYITASLVDRNGLFIEDLTRDEVIIRQEGIERKIEFMASNEMPMISGMVFERNMFHEFPEETSSRTTRGSGATQAKEIAYELIDKLLGRQSVWVALYDRELEVIQDTTTDGFQAKDAIQRIRGVRRPKESFFYSAVLSSVTKMSQRSENRRVLLFFLDILDTETSGKLKPLKNLLSSSNVELFVICFASKLGSARSALLPQMSQSTLKELAGVTAGEAFFATEYREHSEDLIRRIYNHIRTFYTFGFEADSNSDRPGALLVRCTRPGSKVRHHPAVAAPQ